LPRRFLAYLHLAEMHAPYMGPYNRYRVDSPDPAEQARAQAVAEDEPIHEAASTGY
jgi:hypothetical protein